MIKTIFKNTFFVGLLILCVCAVLFLGMQYTRTIDESYETLRQEALCAEQGVLLNGKNYLEKLKIEDRVIWIGSSGEVLYDSSSDGSAAGRPDQKDRDEIRDAFEEGEGKSFTRSDDSGSSSLSYAIKCEDGSVLCFTRPISPFRAALIAASPVLWVLVLVTLISGTFAFRAARQLVTPINNLDLAHFDNNPYPELNPLLDKIKEQQLTIQEEAASREEMRREFSANVSHELKTPLTSISGFAELMAQGVVSEDRVVEFSNDIYRESQRLISLIDDIIKLSRLDEESVIPKKAPVDLYELSEDVVESLQQVAGRSNITMNIEGEHLVISGVYQLLYEMLFNLCDNAIKYNYPGGSVTVSVSSGQDTARLSVSDTGIGISEEHQKRVFERFYRVDKSHSREIGGTGLGLSIVKHGALYHNAEIELHSEETVGTEITLIFPLNEAE